MNERHEREKEIFAAAAALPTQEARAACVGAACGEDSELRQRVLELLEGSAATTGLLRVLRASGEVPEEVIAGRYRLLEKIGEGGFGEVWRAEQSEPVQRLVAVKIIKLGMDTREVVARFAQERQALALMDHPNIAKIHDAGITGAGCPFVVMELIRGVKITNFCDARGMTVRDRLRLFMQVCQAVQHAHQKGVIHRDIKPSNVLVTECDGEPLVKIIDFGIAKATRGALADQTLVTEFMQFLGTPAYMSPEQVDATPDIDTRSDIYSLGVLLYELLTGYTPIERETLARAGLAEFRRLICEVNPPRPSARVTSLSGVELNTVSQHRLTNPEKLPATLRDDLDWIVMKSLEKDRQRRYAAAGDFAADLQRHLHNEPVLARPPGRLYRLRKLVLRNKLTFAAGGSAVAALAVGLGIALSGLQRERIAREAAAAAEQRARVEAARSSQVAGFLGRMLQGVKPSVAQGRDTTLLREILARTEADVRRQLVEEPDVLAELLGIIGGVYQELGDYPKAETLKREVLQLRTACFGTPHRRVADAIHDLANALYAQKRLPEAADGHRAALAMRQALHRGEHADVADSISGLANVAWEQGRLQEAEKMHREALAMRLRLRGGHSLDVAESLDNLGGVLSLRNKLGEAETTQRRALALTKELLGQKHPDVAISLNNLADTLMTAGRLEEAETIAREVLALRIELLSTGHPDVAFSLSTLANVLAAEKKLPEAEKLYREALAVRRKLLGSTHLDVAASLNNLAALLIKTGPLNEAAALLDEALAIETKALPAGHQDIRGTERNQLLLKAARAREGLLHGWKKLTGGAPPPQK